MADDPYRKPIKVTITDPDTGKVLDEKVIANDYVLICAGNRYLKSAQMWGSTVQLNVAVDKGANKRGDHA